ncbi:MAG: hypothetical protein ACYSWR_03970, partial [Planctomycetota bacterium]
MKARNLAFAVVLLFFAESLALANRQLDQGEINQILRTLTGEPRRNWEINIDSHTKQDESRESHENIDLNANRERVFVWDGEQYTVYFKAVNQAVVIESPSDIPVTVNGPLTAGIVPWGYGMYTLESLSAAESSAVVDNEGQIHLTILMETNRLTLEMVLVLDPTKNYAV